MTETSRHVIVKVNVSLDILSANFKKFEKIDKLADNV